MACDTSLQDFSNLEISSVKINFPAELSERLLESEIVPSWFTTRPESIYELITSVRLLSLT